MPKYYANRKKIRGWKRRVKHLDRWGEQIKQPYTNYFVTDKGRHTYERYTVAPFYNAVKRNPPLWFYKLIIAKLVMAYHEWIKTFDPIGIPFDLQLWLYDPAYIRSEIICYKMQQPDERRRFAWESALEKPFPFDKLGSRHYDLHAFEWILADDEHIWFGDDLENAEFTSEDLLSDGYTIKQQPDGTVYYVKRLGDIWIGRHKNLTGKGAKDVVQGYFAPPRASD